METTYASSAAVTFNLEEFNRECLARTREIALQQWKDFHTDMASFALPDDPDANGVATSPVELTDLERDFLGFLLYQYGDTWVENEAQIKWDERLKEKLDL
jgi:hypothetical protein